MVALKKIISWIFPVRVKTVEGEISPRLEVFFENGRKVLHAGPVNYSYGGLHTVFQVALKKARIEEMNIKDVLILGFGAGSIASILVEEIKVRANITGVEADEAVILLAKEEFSSGRFPGLEIIHQRAEDFISATEKKFDLIAVDVFVEAVVPQECKTEKFLKALYDHLQPGGCVVFNEMPGDILPAQDDFPATFGKIFTKKEIHTLRLSDVSNRILIGRKNNQGVGEK